MKALAVENERKAAAYLRKGLAENGFVVDVAHDGADGLHRARSDAYDLVILDVMLPGRDGWSARAVRAVIDRLNLDDSGKFLSYDGSRIAW